VDLSSSAAHAYREQFAACHKTPQRMIDEVPYGYCTEFLIKGKELNLKKIRKHLA